MATNVQFPAGLEAIYRTCMKIYDTQPNPLQLSPALKYWLGGPDPLDFVTVYWNGGDRTRNIPAHWHYVSCGLSNLYGDNRTLQRCRVPVTLDKDVSGFGFELTFRLQSATQDSRASGTIDAAMNNENLKTDRELSPRKPPKWPAALLNSIARYVLQTGTPICPGDEIPWNTPLNKSGFNENEINQGNREHNTDDSGKSQRVHDAEEDAHLDSRIRHLLVCEDAQLGSIHTSFGSVRFLQLIGVTDDELFAAQNWTAFGVIDLMRSHDESKAAAVTPSRYVNSSTSEVNNLKRLEGAPFGSVWLVTNIRRKTSLLDVSECKIRLLEAIETEGSNLSGIIVTRLTWTATVIDESTTRTRRRFFDVPTTVDCEVQLCSEVELELDVEAARFLPLAIRGRLRHGRHFTLTSVPNQDESVSVTFVCRSVPVGDGIVDRRRRFAIVNTNWLHVYLSSSMFDELLRELAAIGIQSTLFAPTASGSGAQTHEAAKQAAANRKRVDGLLEKLKRRLGRHSLAESTGASADAERAKDDEKSERSAGRTSSKSPSEISAAASGEGGGEAAQKDTSSRVRSAGSARTSRSGASHSSKQSDERAQPAKTALSNSPAGVGMATRVLSWPHYGMRIRISC